MQTDRIQREHTIKFIDGMFIGSFQAMASPCEIIIDSDQQSLAKKLTALAAKEAWRIEQKFSRYRKDGIVPQINNSQGVALKVDDETSLLLDFAYQCYDISDGLFDISSGILRKIWHFDASDNIPKQSQIDALLPAIGLNKATWEKPWFTLPKGMEIDLGGIGKEYAVDRVLKLLQEHSDCALLVNFGGDIAANKPPHNKAYWSIGVEDKAQEKKAQAIIQFPQGAIATSGDVKRYLLKGKKRYSHILNPKTGWPVAKAPSTVTVIANTCTEAGILATLAMLHGKQAEKFLAREAVDYRVQR